MAMTMAMAMDTAVVELLLCYAGLGYGGSLIDWFIGSFGSSVDSFIDCLVHWFMGSLIDWFID
jgi:opacity protein-like surface antigen